METQHAVQNRPWVPHAGGQDDGSLHKLPQTTVILPPGMGNPGSVLHGMLRFWRIRRIRGIRFRTPRRPQIEYSTVILAFFAGKWVPKLSLTFKKPKENQYFRLQPLKNL